MVAVDIIKESIVKYSLRSVPASNRVKCAYSSIPVCVNYGRKYLYVNSDYRTKQRVKMCSNLSMYVVDCYTYFITITTCQHRDKSHVVLTDDLFKYVDLVTYLNNDVRINFNDKFYNKQIGLFFKNFKETFYFGVTERQEFTGDLHYHFVVQTTIDSFDIGYCLNRLNNLFCLDNFETNLFNVKRCYDVNKVKNYLSKYLIKTNKRYSSLYITRRFLSSHHYNYLYKTRKHLFRKLYHDSLISDVNFDLKVFKDEKYFVVYQYVSDFSKKCFGGVFDNYLCLRL